MRKFICITCLVFLSTLQAQNKVGTTAAEFLTIPAGSKALSMGGANVAVTGDITSAYYNPGSLAQISGNQFITNYSEWIGGSKYSWIGLGIKMTDDDYLTLSVINLDYGEDEITTIDYPEGTGEMWQAADIALNISYSRNLTDRFSIGGTVKYIQQKIWNESASSFAADVGLLYRTAFEGLNIGMSIANFGSQMKLDGKDLLRPIDLDDSYNYNNSTITSGLSTDSWELPLIFSVGLSWKYHLFNDISLTTAGDAVIPSNENSYLNFGAQLQWRDNFFLRAGKNSLFKESAEEALAFGAGVSYELYNLNFTFEYAYLDFGVWNSLNRYSVTIGF